MFWLARRLQRQLGSRRLQCAIQASCLPSLWHSPPEVGAARPVGASAQKGARRAVKAAVNQLDSGARSIKSAQWAGSRPEEPSARPGSALAAQMSRVLGETHLRLAPTLLPSSCACLRSMDAKEFLPSFLGSARTCTYTLYLDVSLSLSRLRSNCYHYCCFCPNCCCCSAAVKVDSPLVFACSFRRRVSQN